MKTQSIKAILTLVGLVFASSYKLMAQTHNNVSRIHYDSKEWIISSSIVGGSLIVYLLAKYLIKEEKSKETKRPYRHSHRHYHHRHIVKKTA